MPRSLTLTLFVAVLLSASALAADSEEPSPVPLIVRFSATIPNETRTPILKDIRVGIYTQQQGGAPLWAQDQTVSIGAKGNFSVLLGSLHDGIPSSIFATGEARWVGIISDDVEVTPRVLLVSVPYALKAADAETLGGLPVSAFLTRTEQSSSQIVGTSGTNAKAALLASSSAVANITASGLPGSLAKFGEDGVSLSASVVNENSGKVGIGKSDPLRTLDIGTGGQLTFGNNGYSSSGSPGMFWFSTNDSYGLFKTAGAWSSPNFQQLKMQWDPGIVIDGGSAYGKSGTVLQPNGGRVGINTSTPKRTLDLSRDGQLTFGDSGYLSQGAPGIFWFGSSDSYGLFKTPGPWAGPNYQQLKMQWDPGIVIDGGSGFGKSGTVLQPNGGRVGIGTTAPGALLDVAGNLLISNGGTLTFADGTVQSSSSQQLTSADASLSISNNTIKIADGGITINKLDPSLAVAFTSPVTLSANSFIGPQTVSVDAPNGYAISATNSATTGNASAIQGETSSSVGNAILGRASSTDSTSAANAVHGIAAGGKATGVYGEAQSTTGANFGVVGLSRSSAGIGVFGQASSTSTAGLNNTKGVYGLVAGENGSAGVYGEATKSDAQSVHFGVVGLAHGTRAIGVQGESDTSSTTAEPVGVQGIARSATGYAAKFIKYSTSGNVIAAYSAINSSATPTLILRVDGNGNLRTAGTVSGNGADFAEMIAVAPSQPKLEPGDVVVISEESNRTVELSSESYSTRVVGVYSTKPGIVGRPDALADSSGNDIPVAMIGLVPCKATAENGSIHRGDLLVTSPIPGHVMKATDRSRFSGAIVGKAMQSLESGTGVIEIAVTLQ